MRDIANGSELQARLTPGGSRSYACSPRTKRVQPVSRQHCLMGICLTMKKLILVLVLLVHAPSVVLVNAPGGAYIQCDPQNPLSPVRCSPDS